MIEKGIEKSVEEDVGIKREQARRNELLAFLLLDLIDRLY